MTRLIILITILCLTLSGCSLRPVGCGASVDAEQKALWPTDDIEWIKKEDGSYDHIGVISSWDFRQIVLGLQILPPKRPYMWTNPDTCKSFMFIPSDFYEDPNKGILFMHACREFTVHVYDKKFNQMGIEKGHACRHFTTHVWEIY